MKVERDRANCILRLSQGHYARKLVAAFGLSDCKTVATPLAVSVKLDRDSVDVSKETSAEVPYQKLIGGLMYLTVCTRPDLAFAASCLSQFNNCYTDVHWKAAKRVLRYLAGTLDHCLVFCKGESNFSAYADANWADNSVDMRSFTGLIVKFGNAVISWESRKQKTVALSSTEAEYYALTDVARELCFLKNLSSELGFKFGCVTVHSDSQGALAIVKNESHHGRTKHINVKHFFLRDLVKSNEISLRYLKTDDMIADVLTKGLPRDAHERHLASLGILA